MPESVKFTPQNTPRFPQQMDRNGNGDFETVLSVTSNSLTREICKEAVALNSGNSVAFDNTKSNFFQEGCVLSLITKEIMIPHVKSIRAEHS